jgi:hypothetical protein
MPGQSDVEVSASLNHRAEGGDDRFSDCAIFEPLSCENAMIDTMTDEASRWGRCG